MKRIAIVGCAILAVLLLCVGTGLIGIAYPKLIDNEVLKNPIAVTACDESTMTLADGRRIQLDFCLMPEGWRAAVEKSHYRVDVEEDRDELRLWGSGVRRMAGRGYSGSSIRIPLFGIKEPRNERTMIGIATEIWWPETAEQAAAGQPATRSESKSRGNQKPQPESEGRSR